MRGSNLHQPHRWGDRIRALKSAALPTRSPGGGGGAAITDIAVGLASGSINRSYGCCKPAVAFFEPITCTSRAKIVFDSCHAKIMMFRLFSAIIPSASDPRVVLK